MSKRITFTNDLKKMIVEQSVIMESSKKDLQRIQQYLTGLRKRNL